MDHLTTEFAELKRSVEFLSKKYDEVISQLQVANNRISQQSTTIKNVQEELNKVKKQASDASHQAEELAQYIRHDCLEISGVPPSQSYLSNDIVCSVGKLIGIQVSTLLQKRCFAQDCCQVCSKRCSQQVRNSMQTAESL